MIFCMHKKFTKLGYNLISLPRLRVQMSVFLWKFYIIQYVLLCNF